MFTYLMYDGRYYKIGKSNNPIKRLKTLRTANPTVKLICFGKKKSESTLHLMFKRYLVGGEWFDLPRRAVTWIEYNIGDQKHLKIKEDRKRRFVRPNIDYENYVIDFGKYKRIKITDRVHDEQLR